MHQELDPDGLAYPRAKVHRLVNPRLAVASLMEDSLKDVSAGVRDISILPVEVNDVSGAVPMPEA
jgi:hypothetical protein